MSAVIQAPGLETMIPRESLQTRGLRRVSSTMLAVSTTRPIQKEAGLGGA